MMLNALRTLLLMAAAVLFTLGLVTPMVTFTKMMFFKETHSLLGVVRGLFTEGEWGLAVLVSAFSIALPSAKLIALGILSSLEDLGGDAQGRVIDAVEVVGKWSMADVFLVALTIFAAKATGLVAVFNHPGTYCFAASVLLMMIIGQWLALARKRRLAAEPVAAE